MPVITKAGLASEGLIVSGSWNLDEPIPMSGAFVDRYLTVYGSLPDSFAAQGYAAVQAVLAAARRGGGTTPADIQRGLGRLGRVTNPAPTVLGEFGYTVEREPTYPAVVQQVRAGELVPYR
jgi:branched-chain amino acid transport system substrate-binding protein